MRPPSPVSGTSSCVGAGPRPARLIDAKRAEGKPPHPSQHTPCHLPLPGEGFGAAGSRPLRDVPALRRGAHRAPAGSPPAAPILPGQARSPRGVCPPIQHTRGGSTNGGMGVVHHPRRTRAPFRGPPPISGGRRKADWTRAERMWSRGPAGSVTRRRCRRGVAAPQGWESLRRRRWDGPSVSA